MGKGLYVDNEEIENEELCFDDGDHEEENH